MQHTESMKTEKSILITYSCKTGEFEYIEEAGRLFLPELKKQFQDKLDELTVADMPQVYFTECILENTDKMGKWYRIGFVCPIPGEIISITITDMDKIAVTNCHKAHVSDFDEMTGLLQKNAFVREVEETILRNGRQVDNGEYALVYLDIVRFKAINDMFGMAEGDKLLKYIADAIVEIAKPDAILGRMDADRFLIFTRHGKGELDTNVEEFLDRVAQYELPFKIICNVGIYVTNEELLTVDGMIDRAVLAQASIKGSYTSAYSYYKEYMRKDMLGEQEITGIMGTALEEKQFALYYQPQYNHTTGMLVGAEALVRWIHPKRGMISPGVFVPIFERNGFITKLDLYVFEQTCCFIRKCMDEGLPIVPVSSNFCRNDIFMPDFVEKLEEIRGKYQVPSEYLRVEITESVAVGGSQRTNEIIQKLHECGYIVEMDDFGSGYSSLNILKDIELDIIKLDMLFLAEDSDTKRGGIILSSIVRMAKWLGMPVIAEGVEHLEQADFLRSIGCEYIQGYLYSRPLPEEQYIQLLLQSTIGNTTPVMDFDENLDAYSFWDPASQETLIFSNYVGGAVIFEYHDGEIEILRVNKKYLQELGMNLSEKEVIERNPLNNLDKENKAIYVETLEKAIKSHGEEECETWRDLSSACCGEDRICIRSNIRMLGKSKGNYLFYAMIRNVTAEKHHYAEISNSERLFKMASEQVNIYYWEYNVETKEMRPCHRCMRDLGLPALLTNYPDSAIEMGVFPPEVADMYRDWHVQIANGVKELEAVIPLTKERVPFRVRYTTEFDEIGNPIRAYGSAALVIDEK